MDKLTKVLLKNRAIVVFFLFIIVGIGIYSYYVIPKQENPDTTIAVAVVSTIYPGGAPEDVEKFVTEKLETEIGKLEKVDYYTSMSMDSASVIIIYYEDSVLMEDVIDDLRQTVEDVQGSLPDTCMASEVNTDLISNNQFIISLSSDVYSAEELVSYGQTIQSRLQDVEDVSSVTVYGEKEKQVVVEANIQQMRTYGVSIENILSLMQAQNLTIPAGSISYDSGTVTVSSSGLFENLRDIENTVIGGGEEGLSFVKLKDVASVYIEDTSDKYYVQDGRDTILLVGKFTEGKNAVNIGTRLRKEIDVLKEELPDGLIFHEVMYAPEDIAANINSFLVNLVESIILIMIVVMIGVRIRNALVVSTALPISILITFVVMNLLEIEFQFVSIAALIVSLGILVDNAVVVSEEIQHNLNVGMEREAAICGAVKTTWVPVLTSTLTTVVTFGTIYFVPGVVGAVAGTIPTVVIASLTASYFMSMCGIPVLAYYFFKPEPKERAEKETVVRKGFYGLLNVGIKHPVLTLVGCFATLGVAVVLVLQLGLQFFPYASKPVAYINITGETMNLEQTGKIIEQIGDILDEEELVDNYTASVGGGLPSFFLTVPSLSDGDNVGQVMIQLNEEKLKGAGTAEEAARELQVLMNERIAGATVEVKGLEYSMPTEAKITYTVYGEDVNQLNALAEEMCNALNEIDGTNNVRDSAIIPQYQYKVNLDSELLSSYGLLKYDVIKQLNTSLMGATASTYTASGSEMDIVVRANISSLEELQQMPVSSSISETKVLLGQVADITLEPQIPLIKHYNGKRYINVLSDVLPGYVSGRIETEFMDDYVSGMDTEGVSIVEQGEMSNMMDLMVNLIYAGGGAVLVIYIILLLQFKDFAKPLNILTSIPLSLIGCFFGLWIMRMDLQVMALLGVVSLFGIVVNNGILLIEVIDAQRNEGVSIEEACHEAVKLRFRPIMISSITTCIGLVPLIISNDPMTSPMAVVLLFGLICSTGLTMVVVPTIYYLRENGREKKRARRGEGAPSEG